MKIISLITSTALVLTAVASASAQLVTYTFGPTTSPVVTADLVADHLSASVFSGYTGGPSTGGSSPLSSGAYFNASTWSTSENNYFTFTITPESGYQFTSVSLSFDYRATSTGPTTLAIHSNADSYASSLDSFTITRDTNWYSSGVRSVSLGNITTATTFRIYGSGASSNSGTLRVDNVVLNGSVSLTPVPEPSTCALLGGVAVLGFAGFRRRRSRQFEIVG